MQTFTETPRRVFFIYRTIDAYTETKILDIRRAPSVCLKELGIPAPPLSLCNHH